MFKNTTRRGLAIGAALSLALTGLVASPAQANTPFELKPSAGTTYTTFVDEIFTLEAVLGTGNGGNATQLKFAVTKAAGFAVGATSSVTATAAVTAGAIASASTSHVLTNVGAGLTTRNYLRLAIDGATTASSSVTVAVTAFIDVNNNGAVDAGEPQSAQTVTFAKYSDVASVVTVTQGSEGDTSVKATATLTGINASQLSDSPRVKFTIGGAPSNSDVAAADGVFTDAVAALAKSATVSADVTYRGTKVGATSATMTVTNKTVQALTLSAVVGDNVVANGSAAAKARINTAFALKANVKDAATTTASAVAGADVVFEVSTSAALSATKTLAVNGTTYTTSASLPKTLTIKSDASGDAVVNLVPTGYSTSDTVTLIAKSQNNTTPNMVVSFEAAQFTAAADGHGFLKVVPGATITVNYSVKDQFGVLSTRADRLQVTDGTTTRFVNLSGGKAAASFTASTSNTTLTVTNPEVQEQNTSTLNWAPVAGSVTASAVAVVVTNVADAFDGTAVLATASAVIARATTTGDIKLTNAVSLTGSVNHAGAVVTVTGAGVEFAAAGDKATSVGSITLNTDANGDFTVSAYIKTVGAKTVTYTVGTATKSTVITPAAALGNEGKTLTVNTNDRANPGTTVVATIKLVDEYGNPVAAKAGSPVTESFSVTVAGLGFVGALPTALNAAGEATVTVLLGSADAGNLVITATYDADGTGTASTAITTVKTVTVGAETVNAVIGSFKGRWAVRIENGNGSTISVKVGGNWFKYTSLNDNYLFSRKSRVGASVRVSVYVNGSLENTETITVK